MKIKNATMVFKPLETLLQERLKKDELPEVFNAIADAQHVVNEMIIASEDSAKTIRELAGELTVLKTKNATLENVIRNIIGGILDV